MHSGQTHWRLGHRPALDGLRGVAILLVLAGHTVPERYGNAGAVGVSVFFALSGFLITSLLIERRDRTGSLDLGGFYIRRARRLLPAALLFLAAMFACGLYFHLRWIASPRAVLWPLLYVENFAAFHGRPTLDALSHLWSLSTEEQFYLVWPAVLLVSLRRRWNLVHVTTLLLAVSLVMRVWLLTSGATLERIYYAPDTNACLLLVGCLVAALAPNGSLPALPAWAGWASLAVAAMLGALPLSRTTGALVPLASAVLAVPLMLAVVADGSLSSPRWLNWTGRRSYALYLWHFPLVMMLPMHLIPPPLVTVPFMLVLTFGIAALSWRYVEEPFLRKPTGRVRRHPRSEVAALSGGQLAVVQHEG